MITLSVEPSEAYELIDTGNGHRLERLGQHTVVRPDSSVLWAPTSPQHPAWQNPDLRFVPGDGERWSFRKPESAEGWDIHINKMVAHVKPTPFRHLGIFPEQQANWTWLAKQVQRAGRSVRVLNLFGYTGVASIVAAQAGAQVTHVDSSKGTVFWASENARRSGLSEKGIRWIVDDVSKFVHREVKRGAKYDIIIMDPPVFGRGTKGEIWRLEEDLAPLLSDIAQLFAKEPSGFLLNFYATPLYPGSFARLVKRVIEPRVGECVLAELMLIESESRAPFQSGFCLRSHSRQ